MAPGVQREQGRVTVGILNVTTLAKQLDCLLSFNFDLYFLTEVRAPRPSVASLKKRCFAKGFFFCFLFSPPLLLPFLLRLVAFLANSALSIRPLSPPLLQKWHDIGRTVVAPLILSSGQIALVCVFGLPKAHLEVLECSTNETMLAEVFHWASSLSCPVFIGGDLNETPRGKHRSARVTRPNVSMQEEMFLRIAFCLVSLSVVYFRNQGECGHAKLCHDV